MGRAVAALLVVVVLGVAALVVRAATLSSDVSFPLGVVPALPVAPLATGQSACQRPLGVDGAFDAVLFNPGTPAKLSPAADVLVRDAATGRLLATGRLPAGFDRTRSQTVRFPSVSGRRPVAVCFRNRGPARLEIYGDASNLACTPTARGANSPSATCPPGRGAPTNSTSEAYIGGRDTGGDMSVTLLRVHGRSLLDRLPSIMRRAALFRPAFVSAGLWWALLACWLLATPLLLADALRRARPADGAETAGAS